MKIKKEEKVDSFSYSFIKVLCYYYYIINEEKNSINRNALGMIIENIIFWASIFGDSLKPVVFILKIHYFLNWNVLNLRKYRSGQNRPAVELTHNWMIK